MFYKNHFLKKKHQTWNCMIIGNDFSVSIEVLTLDGETEYFHEFCQDLINKWVDILIERKIDLRKMLPHWGKLWDCGFTINGITVLEHLKQVCLFN